MMKKVWNSGLNSTPDDGRMTYFREHVVFERLFKGFREKYASYGSFGGTVILKNLDSEDIEALEGFFQKSFHGQKSVSVSAKRFEKALSDSRLAGMKPEEVLEMYFGEKLTDKKGQRQAESDRWRQLYEKLMIQYADTPAAEWITAVREGENGFHSWFKKQHQQSVENLLEYRDTEVMQEAGRLLTLGADIFNNLPYRRLRTEYLPVFAAELTGNPHALDHGTREGQLLSMIVQWVAAQQSEGHPDHDAVPVFRSLKRQKDFLLAGILLDDISNYALLCGVQAVKKDGSLHGGMDGFAREGDMVQLPLSVIAGLKTLICPEQVIYIVENPSIYAMLCKKWKGQKACMCMNGQPRLSALMVLDLLAESGTTVRYAGDFDPEGLMIACKLRKYYRGSFEYWHMTEPDYQKSRSKEMISARRMRMLDGIEDEELAETVRAVRRAGVAGYQENIWRLY